MHTAIVLTVVVLVSLFIALGYNVYNTNKVVELNYDSVVVEVQKVVDVPEEPEFVDDPALANSVIIYAIRNKDVSFCNKFKLEENQNECLLRYYTSLAVEDNDVRLCDTIPSLDAKEECKRKVA